MKKTVIFHANHSAALYQFIVLKKKFYPDDNIVLLINNINIGNSDFAQGLVQNKIFDKIIFFCEPFDNYKGITGNAAINAFYDELFDTNGLSFDNISKIITACDIQNWFGLYCAFHNIFPDFLEMHDSQFLDFYRYSGNRISSNGPLWIEELSLAYHILDGEDERVKTRYLCKNSIVKFEEKDIVIDFIEEFYNLPYDFKINILDAMKLKNTDYSNCNLLLLNSFGWTFVRTKQSYPNHYLAYLLLADYYFGDDGRTVLFKDHPQTDCKYFNDVLSKRENVISSIIPIEFLGLINDFKINKLLSVNSTGNDKISRFVKVQEKAQDSYLSNYNYLHRLYVTLMLESCFDKSFNFHAFGINTEFVQSFIHNSKIDFRYEGIKGINPSILKWNIFTIIGKTSHQNIFEIKNALKNADTETKIVFWEDEIINALREDDIDIISNIVPIKIKKSKLYNDTLHDFHTEIIYFFCKSDELKQIAQRFTVSKDLIHTGISLHASYDGCTKDIFQRVQIQNMISRISDLEKQILELKQTNEKELQS